MALTPLFVRSIAAAQAQHQARNARPHFAVRPGDLLPCGCESVRTEDGSLGCPTPSRSPRQPAVLVNLGGVHHRAREHAHGKGVTTCGQSFRVIDARGLFHGDARSVDCPDC